MASCGGLATRPLRRLQTGAQDTILPHNQRTRIETGVYALLWLPAAVAFGFSLARSGPRRFGGPCGSARGTGRRTAAQRAVERGAAWRACDRRDAGLRRVRWICWLAGF